MQINPRGLVLTEQPGQNSFEDNQGYTVYAPPITLSYSQRATFGETQAAMGNMAGIANEQSAFLKDYLSEPFECANAAAEQLKYHRAPPRILERPGEQKATLANKGIREGATGWDFEMCRLSNANANLGTASQAADFSALITSDRRMKEDMKRIGETSIDLLWYGAGDPILLGSARDDVRKVAPEAIVADPVSGFDRVHCQMAMVA